MLLLVLFACDGDKIGPAAPDDSASSPGGPGPAFDALCGDAAWDAGLADATLPEAPGLYAGYSSGHADYKRGTVESSKIIPPHPFHVRTIRMEFADGDGTARIRLMETMGRSYPGGYPELDTEGVNLIEPVEVEVVATPDERVWVEIDVSDQGVFLLPTQHYVLVNEYPNKGAPTVAFGRVPNDENSRALLILPDEDTPYGIPGNYRMELLGETFCAWEPDARSFGEVAGTPFADDPSPYALVNDIDGDAHADVVTYGAGPRAWLGDGAGGFAEAADPWPEATYANWMIFGDVDNDGDADAYAGSHISADGDGDGWTLAEGDCVDVDAAVLPGGAEVDNGYDDDCDGIADDGLDEEDADADGASIVVGDCDDTRADVGPDVPELKDGRDNDCDGEVDEDFVSRILLNDGTGRFTAVAGSGVEVTEPSTAGGFGDGDADGSLDLYVGNWLEHYPDDLAVQDRYWEGNGDGTFTDARDDAGLTLPTAFSCYGVEWNDWNNDGHPDILVANYHLFDNQLWANQGDGTFLDVAPEVGIDHDEELSPYEGYPGGHSYGGDFGDIDNDGDMDLYQTNLSHPRTQPWADPSMFVINQGAPDFGFENRRVEYGFVYDEGDVNAQFADFDNDMDLDIAIASLYSTHYARVYQNEGGTAFTDVTYQTGVNVEDAVSVVWVDYDEDGDEDLIVADRFDAPYVHLYENRVGQTRHWVNLDLQGVTSNRDGVGARVTLTAGGVTQLREVQDGNGSFNTQRMRTVHFGLGDNTTVTSVTVRWVGGGTETFTGVGVDGTWRLVEGAGAAAR